jgi:hypothetical protein
MISAGRVRNLSFLCSKGEKMNNRKTIGIILLAVGALLLIGSLAADIIGIGGAPGFGYKQIAGTIVGVIVAVGGYILYSKT